MIQDKLSFFGRTIEDEKTGAVFMNWTGSGFEMFFEGRRVDACFVAVESVFQPEGTLWPVVSVFIDDEDVPVKEVLLDRPMQMCPLFESQKPERHKIKVVKRSENDKGKFGIAGIDMDGELLPLNAPAKKPRLELIGDSITCGYGNEAKNRDGGFLPAEENGLAAYGAVTARLLGAEYHSVSVSGISLCNPLDPDFSLEVPGYPGLRVKVKAMEDYYEYTDRLHEEARGKREDFTKWDFRRFKPDAIVINLGTNDSYRIKAAKDKQAEIDHFESRYLAFIKLVRRLNGAEPVICCTLGSMDYYLYDNIAGVVRKYKNETSDERIFSFKFGGIFPIEEGYGAGDHPSLITHRRMGEELFAQLRPWIQS